MFCDFVTGPLRLYVCVCVCVAGGGGVGWGGGGAATFDNNLNRDNAAHSCLAVQLVSIDHWLN